MKLEHLRERIAEESRREKINIKNFDKRFSDKRLARIFVSYIRDGIGFDEGIERVIHQYFIEENMPECKAECPWRMCPERMKLQRNALRIEVFVPESRCGARLRFSRLGGQWDDYDLCTFPHKRQRWI